MTSKKTSADLVLKNANIITVDEKFSIQEAVAVSEGKILAVGSNNAVAGFITPLTRVLDLDGKTVLPGINDSHMHGPFFGATRPPLSLDLTYPAVGSIADMVRLLEEKTAQVEPGEWIRGFGWDQSTLEECRNDPAKLPRKSDIDQVSPDHPVVFTDFSGHTLLANSCALKLAGITTETPDPKSGEIERDPATAEPTGIFKELGAQSLVAGHVPLLTREEKKQSVITTLEHLAANGVTSYTDAAIGPGGDTYLYGVMSSEFCDIYKELLEEGQMTARVTVLILLGSYGALSLEDIRQNLKTFDFPESPENKWLNFPGLKIFADGIPLTYTSWMNEAYVSGDAGHGSSVIPGDTDREQADNLMAMIDYVHSKGYQMGIHATGDRAIDAAVHGLVRAAEKNPGNDLRHYIIHADFISAEKARLLSRHNFGVSMQPFIQAMICDFEPAVVGAERAAKEFPLKTVVSAGIPLTNSSDAPVTYPNWRMGIQAAVLRKGLVSGKISGPDECLTVEEAIRTYTINGAWQDHMEDIKGSVEPGKVADFCVIDRNILTTPPEEIGTIEVLMTFVDGKQVFEKKQTK